MGKVALDPIMQFNIYVTSNAHSGGHNWLGLVSPDIMSAKLRVMLVVSGPNNGRAGFIHIRSICSLNSSCLYLIMALLIDKWNKDMTVLLRRVFAPSDMAMTLIFAAMIIFEYCTSCKLCSRCDNETMDLRGMQIQPTESHEQKYSIIVVVTLFLIL